MKIFSFTTSIWLVLITLDLSCSYNVGSHRFLMSGKGFSKSVKPSESNSQLTRTRYASQVGIAPNTLVPMLLHLQEPRVQTAHRVIC